MSLREPVKLPCGLVFPNRLVKAAMAELMAGWSNTPNPTFVDLYDKWGQGAWGAVLTGNVQVDINHLGTPFDPALPGPYTDKESNPDLVSLWSQYAAATQQHGPPAIVQICHPGRQSVRVAGRRGLLAPTIAPSAIPLAMGDGWLGRVLGGIVFPAPREMTQADIDAVTARFVDAARLMADAGFSGVQLHGAHGYLIDQFLNPKTNKRTDAYGGSPAHRAKFVLDILAAIRAVVPARFAVGIKLNSADHSAASFEDTMTQIGLLVEAGIDFLEVSGGSYEDPKMMGLDEPKSARTAAREAFFLEFATAVRQRYPSLVLMLTGGFRTRAGAEAAIAQGACDLVGIGRPAAVDPAFARLLLDESVAEEEARLVLNRVPVPWYTKLVPLRAVGGGLESAYYAEQIQRIAKGLKTVAPM
ncbi:hypothetical protein HFD88_009297 [Aspergillus terreus]|nr:hypothetical protein HFD88_009297 [Aspergillus terreus]